MKFTIDRELTTLAKVSAVKKAFAEFKTYFTEKDLVRAFEEQFYELRHYNQVLSCEISGFSSSLLDNDVTLQINLLLYNKYIEFQHIIFYIEYNASKNEFKIDNKPETITHIILNKLMNSGTA